MQSQKHFCKLLVILGLGLSLVSCAMPMKKAEKWLDTKQEKPGIDITGKWDSREWGEAEFNQNEREVRGKLGDYPAKGVVSGNNIYLLMYDGDKVDYIAELKVVDENTLQGSYCQNFIPEQLEGKEREILRPVNLKRGSKR
jgi:hypothetical protein